MFFENRDKYPPPTHRDFSPEAWLAAAASEDEQRVAEFAVHVNSIHARIRRQAQESYRSLPRDREARVAGFLSLLNFHFAEMLLAADATPNKSGASVGEIISQRITGIAASSEMTPDEAIASFVDSVRFPLFDLLRADDGRFLDEPGDLNELLRFHAHAGQLYQVWYDLWQDVELRMLRPSGDGSLIYEQPELAWCSVLAAHRVDRDAVTRVVAGHQLWRNAAPSVRRRYAQHRVTVRDGKLRFRRGVDSPESVPLQFLLTNQLAIEVSDEALRTRLPRFDGATIAEFVRCWEVLSMVATNCCQELQDLVRQSSATRPVDSSACVYRFDRFGLIKDLSQCTGIGMGVVSHIVDAMTYTGDRVAALWGRPLIKAGGATLQLFLAPLVMGRLTYPLKDWVKAGGGNLSTKGVTFEKQLYLEVQNEISSSSHLYQWKVLASVNVQVGSREEEIDLLLITSDQIFVVEAKNFLPGYEPHEVVRYLASVGDGCSQAIRKASNLCADRSGLMRYLAEREIEVSENFHELEILPLVVMYGPLGVGLDWPCPVVDRSTLVRFLSNEQPSFFEAAADGARKIADGGGIFHSADEAEKMFVDYMRAPPIIERYKSLLIERAIPLFDDVGASSRFTLKYYDLALDPEEVGMAQRSAESREKRSGELY